MFGSITDEEIAANAGKTYQDVTALRDPLAGLGYEEPGGEVQGPFEAGARDAVAMDYPGQPREKNGRFAERKMPGAYEKPTGFTRKKNGDLTLDKTERKRYDNLLLGEKTSDGVTVRSISQHAYDRAAQRGISPGQIQNAMKSSPNPSKRDPACREYDKDKIRVVVNFHNGTVVSVMKRRGAK